MKTRKRSLRRPTSVVIQHLLRLITRDCSRVKADLFVTVPLRYSSVFTLHNQTIHCVLLFYGLISFSTFW